MPKVGLEGKSALYWCGDAPRWRLALCKQDNPLRTALLISRRLLSTSQQDMFTGVASCEETGHVLVAAHVTPVGTAIGPPGFSLPVVDDRWLNRQDRINLRRGIELSALYLLKSAASRACLAPLTGGLRCFEIVPLPGMGGKVMLRHRSGWYGRGIAWLQEGLMLALAWQAA